MQPEPPAQVLQELHIEELPVELPEQGQEAEEGKQRYALIDPRGGEDIVPILVAEDSIVRASNVTVEGNLITGANNPVDIDESEGIVVQGNDIRASALGSESVEVSDSTNITLTSNHIHAAWDGVHALRTTALTLHNNTFTGGLTSVSVRDSQDLTAAENTFHGVPVDISLQDSRGLHITRNAFLNASWGVHCEGCHTLTLSENLFQGNGVGTALEASTNATVRSNAFHTVAYGVLSDTRNIRIHGNTLQGSAWGIYAGSSPTISNNTVTGYWRGIGATGAESRIEGNHLGNTSYGIVAFDAPDSRLLDNHADEVTAPYVVIDAPRTYWRANQATARNIAGAFVVGSPSNVFHANTFASGGIYLEGSGKGDLVHEIPQNNTVVGDPIIYLLDATDRTLDRAGQIILVNSTDIMVTGITLELAYPGILAWSSTNVTVRDSVFTNSPGGIFMDRSQDIHVTRTDLGETYAGVYATRSTDVRVSHSRASPLNVGVAGLNNSHLTLENTTFGPQDDPHAELGTGTFLGTGSTGAVRNATYTNLTWGTILAGTDGATLHNVTFEGAGFAGLLLLNSAPANISRNTFRNNTIGTWSMGGGGNELRGNLFLNNRVGTYLDASSNNTLRDNRFHGGALGLSGSAGTLRQDVQQGNLVNGEPLHYVHGEPRAEVEGTYGQVLVVSSPGARVLNVTVPTPTASPLVLVDSDNATVDQATFHGYAPIKITRSANVTMRNTTIHNGGNLGLLAMDSPEPHVMDSSLLGTGLGIGLATSPNGVIEGSGFASTTLSLSLYNSPATRVDGNVFAHAGLAVAGQNVSMMKQDVGENTVQGKPLVFLQDALLTQVTEPAGQVIVLNSSHVTVSGQSFNGGALNVQVLHSDTVSVEESVFNRSSQAVFSMASTDVTVTGSTFHEVGRGVSLWLTDGSEVTDSLFHGRELSVGVEGVLSQNVEVHGNTLRNFTGAIAGFHALQASIHHNNITGNQHGIRLALDTADAPVEIHQNNIVGNTVSGVTALTYAPVNATGNWWGCADGPEGGGCDTASQGVLFDPWLEQPATDAGDR